MKSTLATQIGAEAERAGVSAAILELDSQGTASQWSDLRGAPPHVTRIDSNALPQALERLKARGKGLVVLDCAGTHSPAINAAIKASDLVLIPARPQPVDISASAETLAICQRLGRPYAYVLGPCAAVGSKATEARAAFEREGYAVAPVDIGLRNIFVDAVATGRTVFEMEPKGKAAVEIHALWTWLRKELGL
jgi:chromosome partitioning protein